MYPLASKFRMVKSMIDFIDFPRKKFSALETDYFGLKLSLIHFSDKVWFASGEIFRRDTGEVLKRTFTARGLTESEAAGKLYTLLGSALQKLKVPADWGAPDPVRMLINLHVRYRCRLSNITEIAEQKMNDGHFVKDSLYAFFRDVHRECLEHAVLVCAQISSMKEDGLLRLVAPEDEKSYEDFSEKNEERLLAMQSLFDYIACPSEVVVQAHCKHLEKMASE